MKKNYISPTIEIVKLAAPALLVVSGSGELGAPAIDDPMLDFEDDPLEMMNKIIFQ